MKLIRWIHRQIILGMTHSASIESVGLSARFHVNSKPEYKVIVGGLAESRLRESVFAELRADDVMVEVGAHVGSWSVFFAKYLSQGYLHAFEPVPHNCDKLKANLDLNDTRNATAYQKAIGDEPGSATFSLEDNDAPVQGTLLQDQAEGHTFSVEVDTLDRFAESLDRPPTALKIDCEGAEAMVLRGGSAILSDSIRVIFLELHAEPLQRIGEDPEQLIQSLIETGFELKQRWPDTQHALFVKS
jgi:FkbM family methyltransferase